MTEAPQSATPLGQKRIAIIDDDPTVRKYFMRVLVDSGLYEVVGVAHDIASGRALIPLAPDLFLIDIGLPDGSGYDLVPEIKARCTTRALIVSAFGDRNTVVRALASGADGYLLKDSTPEQVLDGVAITLDGGAPVSPAAAVYLIDFLRQSSPVGPEPIAQDDTGLTARELDLLRAFAAGRSYKEAARDLGISPHTVGNHVKSIYRKLQVRSRSEALRAAGLQR
jgi:DNA-binding NarL/FixJ family response regulator